MLKSISRAPGACQKARHPGPPWHRARHMSSSTPAPEEPIAGTVAPHNAYILLHTHTPPPAFPAKIKSGLQRTLQLHAAQFGALVNFAWTPAAAAPTPAAGGAPPPEWDHAADEAYAATAFARHRGRLDIPRVAADNVDAVAAALRAHCAAAPYGAVRRAMAAGPLQLYVCTHGARDCRCGTTGGAVFDALRSEVERRPEWRGQVDVGGVGHVGGHKYAANVLIYPWGEWLGNVKPEDVPSLLEVLMQIRAKGAFDPWESPPLLGDKWRGRMGFNKEDQLKLAGQLDTPKETSPGEVSLNPHPSRSS